MKATNRYQPYEERTIPSPRGPNSCPQISVMKAVLTTPRQSTNTAPSTVNICQRKRNSALSRKTQQCRRGTGQRSPDEDSLHESLNVLPQSSPFAKLRLSLTHAIHVTHHPPPSPTPTVDLQLVFHAEVRLIALWKGHWPMVSTTATCSVVPLQSFSVSKVQECIVAS